MMPTLNKNTKFQMTYYVNSYRKSRSRMFPAGTQYEYEKTVGDEFTKHIATIIYNGDKYTSMILEDMKTGKRI